MLALFSTCRDFDKYKREFERREHSGRAEVLGPGAEADAFFSIMFSKARAHRLQPLTWAVHHPGCECKSRGSSHTESALSAVRL